MKRNKIIILLSLIAIPVFLYLLLSFFINSILLPQKIKPRLTEAISLSTGKKTEIDKISFSFPQGLSIENLVIQNIIDNLPLKLSQIYLKVKFLPIIFQKELVFNLRTSPIEKLNIYLAADGIYKLNDQSLATKFYINEFPLVLAGSFIPQLPFEIQDGKTNIEADLEIDSDKNIDIDARLPIRNLSLKAFKQTLSGKLSLDLHLSRTAKSELTDYRGKISLEKLELSLPVPNQVVAFSKGEIDFNKDTVEVNDLAFTYSETPYTLSGKITNLIRSQPDIKISIFSSKIFGEMDLLYNQKEFNIKKALFKFPASSLELQGTVKDLRNPDVDIYLVGDLNAKDLEILPFKFTSKIKELSLDSQLNTELHLSGKIKEWEKFDSLLKIKSPSLKTRGFIFENVSIKMKTAKENLDAEVVSDIYEGKLKANISQMSLKEKFPFNARLSIEDLSLKKLNETSLKAAQEISGYLATELTCQGSFKAIKEITGEGWLEITEGRLWELPLFKGLAGIIELPGVEKNVFKEAHGNFVIKNQAVATKDLQLISKRLTLNTAGDIYFDGNLDLRIKTQFPEDTTASTSGLDKLQDIFLKGAGSLVKEIHVTGTLKKPEYKVVPVAMENIFQHIPQ